MIELAGDLFSSKGGAICLTTNGDVRVNGAAVMGRGVALQAKKRWPGIERTLGWYLMDRGNRVHHLTMYRTDDLAGSIWLPDGTEDLSRWYCVPWHIVSLPVKHHWRDKADPALIERSLLQLKELSRYIAGTILLPRPGCGNGGLSWREVQPFVAQILDSDRFVVVEIEQ